MRVNVEALTAAVDAAFQDLGKQQGNVVILKDDQLFEIARVVMRELELRQPPRKDVTHARKG